MLSIETKCSQHYKGSMHQEALITYQEPHNLFSQDMRPYAARQQTRQFRVVSPPLIMFNEGITLCFPLNSGHPYMCILLF